MRKLHASAGASGGPDVAGCVKTDFSIGEGDFSFFQLLFNLIFWAADLLGDEPSLGYCYHKV